MTHQNFLFAELKKFTSCDPDKKHMAHVMRYGEYALATNGIVLAFARDIPLDSLKKAELDNDILGKLIEQHHELQFERLEMPDTYYNLCSECHGSGYTCVTDCIECNGKGCLNIQSDYNLYEVVCKSCSGNGVRPSKSIKDRRLCGCVNGFAFNGYLELKGHELDGRHLYRIKDYPDLEISLSSCENIQAKIFNFKSSNGIHVVVAGVAVSK